MRRFDWLRALERRRLRRAYAEAADDLYELRAYIAMKPYPGLEHEFWAEVQKMERDLEARLIELARRDPDMDPELRAWLAARMEPRR